MQLPITVCACPDQMRVEVVAGPYDEVDSYDRSSALSDQQMMDDYLDEMDEHGLAPPEPDVSEPRQSRA